MKDVSSVGESFCKCVLMFGRRVGAVVSFVWGERRLSEVCVLCVCEHVCFQE